MNLENIKHQLDGYFINVMEHNGLKVTETLCKKLSDTEHLPLDNVKTTHGLVSAYDNCLRQINAQIMNPSIYVCDLKEVLPVIRGDIFELWKMRERKIQQHIDLCQTVETEENELSKGRHLVKWKQKGKTVYGIVHEQSLTPVPEELLTEETKETAIKIKYPKMIRTALADDLNNQYEEAYAKEVRKFRKI